MCCATVPRGDTGFSCSSLSVLGCETPVLFLCDIEAVQLECLICSFWTSDPTSVTWFLHLSFLLLPGHHRNHFPSQFPVPPIWTFSQGNSFLLNSPHLPPKHHLDVGTGESQKCPLFTGNNFPAEEHSPLFNDFKIQGFYQLWLCLTNNFQILMACENSDRVPKQHFPIPEHKNPINKETCIYVTCGK